VSGGGYCWNRSDSYLFIFKLQITSPRIISVFGTAALLLNSDSYRPLLEKAIKSGSFKRFVHTSYIYILFQFCYSSSEASSSENSSSSSFVKKREYRC